MGSNWAQEFRRRVEENEGKYRGAEDFDDVDESVEEESEFEPEDEAAEEETEELEEPEEAEIEKPPLKLEMPRAELERQKFRQELDNILGSKTGPVAKIEAAKRETARKETNEWAGVGAAMMGLVVMSLMPTLYQTMTQAFQPLIQSFSGRSYGSQQWVTCPYCGYQCLGYDGMPCLRCGRS